ncbi:E3 ubiquitin-protein ligase TRIM31-like [Microtus ochrogaster]|uniref:E3 ubiquitin-protein ligase TRIM31-like n=1 Tax=Microtus ochrogaster TaxID=79684 RepID=A0ABM0LQS4_MICOH|nr:E3 ubiquitin-protein ligase TRIM31-like [Microtus ochrogaster]
MTSLKRTSKLLEDVICPICIEILQDPVTIDCGHNFCLQCINQKTTATENPQCPLCKLPVDKNAFKPNKQLASLAEKFLAIDPAEVQSEEEPRCQKHKEKFHYFCEKDGEFLCLVCRDSKDHKTHELTVIDEAAQNYKVQIETQVQHLGQKDKEIIKEKKEGEGAIQLFRVLPAHTLSLNLALRSTYLHRGKEFIFHNPIPIPLNLEKKISEAKARHESITESLKKLTDNLNTEGKEDKSTFLNSLDKKDKENWCLLQKNNSELLSSEPMTLDSTSADPNLTFSQDLKKASLYVVDGTSNTQAKPRQFYPFHCVRGSPGLSSGRVLWEVDIQGPPDRVGIVGVVAELPRGSQIQNSESCCLWALRISSSGCQAITNCNIQENLSICLKKVGVYVDYDRGDIVFYDAITNKHIYTFQTSFDRQVFPLFGLLKARSSITLSF